MCSSLNVGFQILTPSLIWVLINVILKPELFIFYSQSRGWRAVSRRKKHILNQYHEEYWRSCQRFNYHSRNNEKWHMTHTVHICYRVTRQLALSPSSRSSIIFLQNPTSLSNLYTNMLYSWLHLDYLYLSFHFIITHTIRQKK